MIIPTALFLGELSKNAAKTEVNSIATSLCVQKTEEILTNYDFDTVTASSGNFNSPYQDYAYQVNVQYVDGENGNLDNVVALSGYKKVTITISHSAIPDVVTDLLFTDT
ncbi:MAG: hypothetical protein JSW17_06815 [Candidatus Omnitrophota bacterium]|nr:MAG: hypothetical protein JSW17_06815 [Candidatus Omnitrophota bacterium]